MGPIRLVLLKTGNRWASVDYLAMTPRATAVPVAKNPFCGLLTGSGLPRLLETLQAAVDFHSNGDGSLWRLLMLDVAPGW